MRMGFIAGAVIALMIAGVVAVNAASGSKLGEQTFNLVRALAGERKIDSETGQDYMSTSPECWPVTVDTATDSTTVYSGPAIVQWVYVNTALSAHTVLLVDGSTTKITLPASMAAGSSPNIAGAMFRTTLVVDPDNSSTGNITVCFRPLDTDSTWTP